MACQANSALVARYISSPEVARSTAAGAAWAQRQAARRRDRGAFQLPNCMLDGVSAAPVSISRWASGLSFFIGSGGVPGVVGLLPC